MMSQCSNLVRTATHIAQTCRLKATAYGGGNGRVPKFGEVTELTSGSP
jgi:hypothetical protein